jgi:hypothetical protein
MHFSEGNHRENAANYSNFLLIISMSHVLFNLILGQKNIDLYTIYESECGNCGYLLRNFPKANREIL